MANTSFEGAVRAKNGFKHLAVNSVTGVQTEIEIVDSSGNLIAPNRLAVTAEHGAGIIGTGATPTTYRWTDGGVIVTQIKIDLAGIASVASANDVLCLTAGGVCFIGRNVVATNGVIFGIELTCIETPLTGDNDINVVVNSSAVLTTSGAGGTTYGVDGGNGVAGQTVALTVQGLTEGHYYYLTGGAGDVANTYTAGQYIITTYGHALLT